MKSFYRVCIYVLMVLFITGSLYTQEDRDGKDHPIISRMPDFYIGRYEMKDFASYTFLDSTDNKVDIEGCKYSIEYRLKKNGKEPGYLMIIRNHENAFKKINGKILNKNDDELYCKVAKDGNEVWIHVKAFDRYYRLNIVEREKMEQKIEANPEALFNDIASTGHVAVYGIYFDHDSANIKPESQPSLKAIADMLKTGKSLNLYVVGHTDMTGGLEYNMKLSLKRADSVVQALVKKYGISANRLAGKGVGPLCPIASNTTDSGKKLNRRVDLVKK